MTDSTNCPEPGIVTDKELREAAQSIVDALDEEMVYSVYCDRFGTATGIAGDNRTEAITVRLSDKTYATKESAINDVLRSDAPVRLRDLEEGDERKLTFHPANQAE